MNDLMDTNPANTFTTLSEAFFNPYTVLFCLWVYVVTLAIRQTVEGFFPALLQKERWKVVWREVFLPLGPICNGAVFAFLVDTYPWPELIQNNVYVRVSFGAVLGLFSGWMYNRVKMFLQTTRPRGKK